MLTNSSFELFLLAEGEKKIEEKVYSGTRRDFLRLQL